MILVLLVERSTSPQYNTRTKNQKKYAQSLSHADNDLLIAVGPAGTGKTLLACTYAVQRLREDSIQKIVLTRPTTTHSTMLPIPMIYVFY